MSIKAKSLIAGSLLACLSGQAFALATSSATLSDISFTLIDLDPTDGITPGITMAPGRLETDTWTSVTAVAGNYDPVAGAYVTQDGGYLLDKTTPFANLSMAGHVPTGCRLKPRLAG